ncbi:MAG: efflux RND transporter periplasmic adaptor subunit [Acidobacteriota bacterium]
MSPKTLRNSLVLALVLAGVLQGACKKAGGGKPPAGNLVPVKIMDLPAQVIATGTVTPRVGAQVKVGPRVSGRLERLYVQVGDRVTRGQTLAILEQRDLQANVDKAKAALASALATADYAKSNYDRTKELLPKGYVSQDSVDAARRAYEQARAEADNAKAQLAYAEVQLSYATVTSPIDGIVGSVSTQEGETVAASLSAPTFVTVIDLSRLEVDAYVDEVDIGRVKVGQAATFTVDAFPDKTFQAVVEAIYPQAVIQDNVVNYAVILGIQDAFEGLLRPQMTASVSITLDTTKGALVVPVRAVKHEGGKAYVQVPEGKGLSARPVTLGRESGEFVQIKAGLSEGDKVFVPGAARANDTGGL